MWSPRPVRLLAGDRRQLGRGRAWHSDGVVKIASAGRARLARLYPFTVYPLGHDGLLSRWLSLASVWCCWASDGRLMGRAGRTPRTGVRLAQTGKGERAAHTL